MKSSAAIAVAVLFKGQLPDLVVCRKDLAPRLLAALQRHLPSETGGVLLGSIFYPFGIPFLRMASE